MEWRIIVTDTEGPTGVAPVCESKDHGKDEVLDCCPHPPLEVWSEPDAQTLVQAVNRLDVEVCT